MIDLLDDDFTVYEQIEKAAKIHDISISELFRRAKVDRQRGHHWSVNEPKSIGTLKKINNVLRELARKNDVFEHIKAERRRQVRKWGEQNHPCLNKTFIDGFEKGDLDINEFKYSISAYYHIPDEDAAKSACDKRFDFKKGTFADIAIEEMAEITSEPDPVKRRKEIIQLAAVCVAWAEKIDRDLKK